MRNAELLILLSAIIFALILSGIRPFHRATWALEVLPVVVALPLLIVTYGRFPFTMLVYRLIFLHALILILGGHYTYARVPLGNWIRDLFDLGRNHYDRLGHFAQGFIPALITREILIRKSPLRTGKWLFFLVVSVCLAMSAFYEFLEWWAAVTGGQQAEAFLGTQGDVWDTQWDMFLAAIGAITSLAVFSRIHDRALIKMGEEI